MGGHSHIAGQFPLGMVGGELFQNAVTVAVDAAVADMQRCHLSFVTEERHQGGSHLGQTGIGRRCPEQDTVGAHGPVLQREHQFRCPQPGRHGFHILGKRAQGDFGGHLAAVVAAHAVGHGKGCGAFGLPIQFAGPGGVAHEAAAGQCHVLIVAADATDVADHFENHPAHRTSNK